jgi:murein DD-endopeptidase MepM/ murein hydrolase activator NlpD
VPWAQAESGRQSASTAAATPKPAVVALSGESHRVRRGDRLGDLAQTFGMSVGELAQANDLEPPYIIRVGQVLQIPAAPGAGPAPTAVAAQTSRPQAVAATRRAPVRTLEPETVPAPTMVAALEAPTVADPPAPKLKPAKGAQVAHRAGAERYTVRSGETLSGIALRLDVPMAELARANDIDRPYRVRAGQKLALPQKPEIPEKPEIPQKPEIARSGAPTTTMVKLGKDDGSVRLATGAPPPLAGDDFLWPVNGKVIGAFGRIDQWRRRDGIDIAAPRGAPVLAAQDGIVAYAGEGIRGYGKMILVRHDQGYITTYAHNAALLVEVGDVVERGQVIARVGDTGDASQSMLHFELRQGRTPIDPQTRLVSNTTAMATATE